MPPKRAKPPPKDAPKAASKTRATRSTASARTVRTEEDVRLESTDPLIKSSGGKARKGVSGGKNNTSANTGSSEDETRFRRRSRAMSAATRAEQQGDADEGDEEQDAAVQVTTPPRPMPRNRRPQRTVRKVVQSEANKAAIEGLKKRMEEEANRLKNGSPPAAHLDQDTETPTPELDVPTTADVATAAAPKPLPSVPTTKQRPAPSILQRKAPGPHRAPGTAQKPAPGSALRAPASTVKVQSTPSADTSILALANFRRRPRQPSLLQMVQNPELAYGVDDTTDFSLGASDDEDGEGFAPHDEGTPIQVEKTQRREATPVADGKTNVEAVVISDDQDSLYDATPLPTPKAARKRKSDALDDLQDTEIQIPRSQSYIPRHSSDAIPSDDNDDADDTIPATAPAHSPNDSLYADPVSSPPPMLPSAAHTRTSPSPTTTRTTRDRTKSAALSKPLTTATLRALLPKRRPQRSSSPAHERSVFDITSSSLGSDASSHDDNDGDFAGRKGGAKRGVLTVARRALQGRRTAEAPQKAGKKTYSRAITVVSDKENASSSSLSELESEGTPPDTSVETIRGDEVGLRKARKVGSEIDERRRFFEEVDEWEMEFESAPSLGGGMGSSPAWR